ncbi:MAG: Phenylacetic acid catabolic protein [Vampirovibrionales bacterium]|nr:Phenylacetic acid catabolic protein [Vampirovibrionales bacterium]
MSAVSIEQFEQAIQNGKKVELNDAMPEAYREALINLMLQQADSELSGAYGYIPWIEKAPNIHEKLLVAQIVKDEVNHAYRMFKLLSDLGIETDERIRKMDETLKMRMDNGSQNIGTERLAEDKRVNIFYYPIETWTDFIMFNFCMDRGAGHQLEDAMACSYAPWNRTIEGIFKEEMMHVNHGNTWVKKLADDPETRDEVQEALNKWYPRTMNIFGRPNSKKNQVYKRFHLKMRDNEDVRQAFKADIEKALENLPLTLPAWVPEYDESV